MSLPQPNFQTGDLFTADHVNNCIRAILASLTAISFDVINATDVQVLFTYNVPDTEDQILNLTVYIDNSVKGTEGCYILLNWTDMEGNIQEFTTANNPNDGGTMIPSWGFKAKRGTVVTFTGHGLQDCIYSAGGSLVVIKSIP